jgi:hypothetical protein
MGMTLTQAKKLTKSMSLEDAKLMAGPELEQPPILARIGRGMMDIAQGSKQLYLKGKDAITGDNEAEDYTRHVDEEVALYEKGRGEKAGIDWWRIGGNVAATLPVALLPGAASAGVAVRTGAGALQGATASALNFTPEGESKMDQVVTGAIAGGALPNVLAGASIVIKPKVRPEVQQLLNEGITPTPGQIIGGKVAVAEDKLTSLPLLGDLIKSGQRRGINELNVASYQRALEPIGATPSGAIGREGVEEVSEALSKAYEDLLPKLQFKADAQFGADLTRLHQMSDLLPATEAKQFQKIIQTQLVGKMTPQGNMSGETFKTVESELSKLAKGYKSDESFDKRQLGEALSEVVNSLRANLHRANPEFADELAKVNLGYANYARIRAAGASDRAGEGFTPAQLQAAVRSADKTIGKGNFAKGKAMMQDLSDAGVKVLASKYPDSGTAGRGLMNLLAAGGLTGSSLINPVIPTLGVTAMLPYTKVGQKVAAGLLAQRPEFLTPVADATVKSGGLINPALMGLLMDHSVTSGP